MLVFQAESKWIYFRRIETINVPRSVGEAGTDRLIALPAS